MAKYHKFERDGSDVTTVFARVTKRIVSAAQKAVVGQPVPEIKKESGRYADWVIVSIHALREYLDQP